MVNVFLLLGSNLGHREVFLQQAIELIGQRIARVDVRSAVYETRSWGKEGLPDYLNQVVALVTGMPPAQLLKNVLQIEQDLGRQRAEKWGSRTIDIDILFYGNEVIDEPDLKVPHPYLHLRGFTLAPLAEIAPHMQHPVLHKSMLELKNELADTLNIKKL